MNKITKLALVIMSTFYMSGCSTSNDDAINYFEVRYKIISNIIEIDNDFQDDMAKVLGVETADSVADSISKQDFEAALKKIEIVFQNLKLVADSSLKFAGDFEEMEDDKQLNRATIALLTTYNEVVANDYKMMLEILRKPYDDISGDDEKLFNEIYNRASKTLDEKINLFYDASDEFCECKNVKLDWEK